MTAPYTTYTTSPGSSVIVAPRQGGFIHAVPATPAAAHAFWDLRGSRIDTLNSTVNSDRVDLRDARGIHLRLRCGDQPVTVNATGAHLNVLHIANAGMLESLDLTGAVIHHLRLDNFERGAEHAFSRAALTDAVIQTMVLGRCTLITPDFTNARLGIVTGHHGASVRWPDTRGAMVNRWVGMAPTLAAPLPPLPPLPDGALRRHDGTVILSTAFTGTLHASDVSPIHGHGDVGADPAELTSCIIRAQTDPLVAEPSAVTTSTRVSMVGWVITSSAFLGAYGSVDMTGADLTGALMPSSTFTDVSFRGASLRDAFASEASFTGCDFTRADLTDATFIKTDFEGCDFTRADLTDATFIDCTPTDPPESG